MSSFRPSLLLIGNAKFKALGIAFCISTLLCYLFFYDATAASLGFPRPDMPSTPISFIPEADFPNASVLLVSAFFPLSKSKHPMSDYEAWFRRFLEPIASDLYFFCTPEVAPLILSLRGDLPITLNTSFSSPFDIPPLKGLKTRYEEMHGWDPEKAYHSAELYAVWNGKPYFLVEGLKNAEAAGKTYNYAFWNDAGSLRDRNNFKYWPSGRRVEQVFMEGELLTGTPKDDLIFFPLWNAPPSWSTTWTEENGPIDDTISEGSFFGGMTRAITHYRDLYYQYHDKYLAMDIFVGKDQTLINSLFYLFPSHFIAMRLYDYDAPATRGVPRDASTPLGECGSTWWYYQWWLASGYERATTASTWMQEAGEKDPVWREAAHCRVTRLLGMRWLLRKAFGPKWNPPRASIRW